MFNRRVSACDLVLWLKFSVECRIDGVMEGLWGGEFCVKWNWIMDNLIVIIGETLIAFRSVCSPSENNFFFCLMLLDVAILRQQPH